MISHALAAQLFDERRDADVGAANRLAAREQDARDRAHADAADADEVVGRHRSPFRRVPRYRSGQESRRADRLLPSRAAPSARACSRCGSIGLREHARASLRPASSLSVRTTAAPAACKRRGVGRLMPLRRIRIRNENRRLSERAPARRASTRRHASATDRPPRRRRPCRRDTGAAFGSAANARARTRFDRSAQAAASPAGKAVAAAIRPRAHR